MIPRGVHMVRKPQPPAKQGIEGIQQGEVKQAEPQQTEPIVHIGIQIEAAVPKVTHNAEHKTGKVHAAKVASTPGKQQVIEQNPNRLIEPTHGMPMQKLVNKIPATQLKPAKHTAPPVANAPVIIPKIPKIIASDAGSAMKHVMHSFNLNFSIIGNLSQK
jgi:hypothetical protein